MLPERASELKRLLTIAHDLVLEEKSLKIEKFAKCTWPLFLTLAKMRALFRAESAGSSASRLNDAAEVLCGGCRSSANHLMDGFRRVRSLLDDSLDCAFWQKVDVHGLLKDDLGRMVRPFANLKDFYGSERAKFEEHVSRWIRERCRHQLQKGRISSKNWRSDLLDELKLLQTVAAAPPLEIVPVPEVWPAMQAGPATASIANGTKANLADPEAKAAAANLMVAAKADAADSEVAEAMAKKVPGTTTAQVKVKTAAKVAATREVRAAKAKAPTRAVAAAAPARNKVLGELAASVSDATDVDDDVEPFAAAQQDDFDACMQEEADIGCPKTGGLARPVELHSRLPEDLLSHPSVDRRMERDSFLFLHAQHDQDSQMHFVNNQALSAAPSEGVFYMPEGFTPIAMAVDNQIPPAQVPKQLSELPRRQPPTEAELMLRSGHETAAGAVGELDPGRYYAKHSRPQKLYTSAAHPLKLDSWAYAVASLLRCMAVLLGMAGFATTWAYKKVWTNHFRAHVEQFYAGFGHHVLFGCILWHLVRPTAKGRPPGENRHLFLQALRWWIREPEVASTLGDLGALDGLLSDQDWLDATLLLLHQKRLYPDAPFLCRHGVEVISLETKANQLLMCGEGVVHWGINRAPYSVSLAVNFMTEGWLRRGLPQLEEHLRWLERIRLLRERLRKGNDAVEACAGALFDAQFDAEYLNLVPPATCCEMLQQLALAVDPAKASRVGTRSAFPFRELVSERQRSEVHAQLLRVQRLLHAVQATTATGIRTPPELRACECKPMAPAEVTAALSLGDFPAAAGASAAAADASREAFACPMSDPMEIDDDVARSSASSQYEFMMTVSEQANDEDAVGAEFDTGARGVVASPVPHTPERPLLLLDQDQSELVPVTMDADKDNPIHDELSRLNDAGETAVSTTGTVSAAPMEVGASRGAASHKRGSPEGAGATGASIKRRKIDSAGTSDGVTGTENCVDGEDHTDRAFIRYLMEKHAAAAVPRTAFVQELSASMPQATATSDMQTVD